MRKLSLFLVLLLAGDSFAGEFQVQDPKRVVKLVGQVDGASFAIARDIEKMSRTSGNIDMLINSPGGSVYVGMAIVEAMRAAKSRGVVFRCAVGVMAASMGFIILNECNERYAFSNARLLFHPVSLSVRGSRVQELLVDLNHTDLEEKAIMKNLQESMGLDWKTFHRNYFAETFWQAAIFRDTVADGWITIVAQIEGFGDDLFEYRKPQVFLFGNQQSNGIAEQILERFENGGK